MKVSVRKHGTPDCLQVPGTYRAPFYSYFVLSSLRNNAVRLRTRTCTAGPSNQGRKKTCHARKMAASSAQKRRLSETIAMPDKDVKRRDEEPTEQLLEVEASSVDYNEAEMPSAGVSVAAASVTYALKGEDRHVVLRLPDDPLFRKLDIYRSVEQHLF